MGDSSIVIAQILAIVIFTGMFLLIIFDKFERHLLTLTGGALIIVLVFGLCMRSPDAIFEAFSLQSFLTPDFWYGASESPSTGINWATILFITGMMIMVEGLGRAGFFRWLCLRIAKAVHYRLVPLLICFMCMAAFLSMFIDSITVVLFLATVTLELGSVLRFNPVPMVLAEIFCANLGGAATMCGDPPNIIIGTSLGYSFSDFIRNTGVISAIGFVVVAVFFWLAFRKDLKKSEAARDPAAVCPQPKTAIVSRNAFAGSVAVFAVAVVLLVTHAQTRLTVATIGVIVAVLTLTVTALTSGIKSLREIMRHLDYKTLLFFIGLFICVSGLEQTGVLDLLAKLITKISGGNVTVIVCIILWLSAIASAFIDNIPFAATMVPVIKTIAATQGVDLSVLAWTLSLGTDLGGNATPIGASANVVGTAAAAKRGHPISWGTYCKYCVPATILVVGISMACLLIQYV
jgi:Na+/H+ antiporter NhaD/arsenite permease-like protein